MNIITYIKSWTIIKRTKWDNLVSDNYGMLTKLAIADNEIVELKNQKDLLIERNSELSAKLSSLSTKSDVSNKDFWNNKWKKSTIYYKAPNRKKVTSYVKDKKYLAIEGIAEDILNDSNGVLHDSDGVALAVMKWVKKQKFKYETEKYEYWKCPEQVLEDKNKGNDCDDIGILMYYIIREMFKQLGKWEEMKHRLKAVAGNVNRRGSIPSSAGGHFYLIWLHSDGLWRTVETTYYLNSAITNYEKVPHKYNQMYGTIWFCFNEEYSWGQHSITVSKEEWKK